MSSVLVAPEAMVDAVPKAHILLVADHPIELLTLERALADPAQHLTKARSADEALRCLLHQDFAVILLDVNMSERSGVALAERLRRCERARHTPILFLSAASPTPPEAFQGYELGLVDYASTRTPEVVRAKVAVFVDLFQKTTQVQHYAAALDQLQATLAQQVARRTAALQRSNEELQQFLHLVAHDLKEPLRGMHTYAYLLLEDLDHTVSDEARAKLQTISHLAQRMGDLLHSLLHFCRLGQEQVAYEDTDLSAVVHEVLTLLQITLTQQGIEVRLPHPLPVVRCDRAQVREVFYNLILNAITYNDKPLKWVEIGALPAVPAGRTLVSTCYVRDNGIGIRPHHVETIFAMFKRLHPHDDYGGGTGAGLTIAKKIVERHGGTLWVESTYGEGSTFYFTLPGSVACEGDPCDIADAIDHPACGR